MSNNKEQEIIRNLELEKIVKEQGKGVIFNHELNFTNDEKLYMLGAADLPMEVINDALFLYDTSSPKMDELAFVAGLAQKYHVGENLVKLRIREVRRINRYLSKQNTENNKKDKKILRKIFK